MKPKRILTDKQKAFGLLLASQTSFMRVFWKDDLSRPPSTRQKLLWNDYSDRVILATGRKTGKTIMLEARLVRGGITRRQNDALDERMVVTPGDNQRNPIWTRVTTKIRRNSLFSLILKREHKNEGVLEWHTGVIHYFRIDGADGSDSNMVGLRLSEIIGDEMQLTHAVTHNSRKQSALPGCRWLYCGVPNGVRHTPFWEIDQSAVGRTWSRHKLSSYVNPLFWLATERQRLIEDYGEGTQDYITQVIGGWGEEVFSSFPPGSIAVDERMPYRVVRLRQQDLPGEVDLDALVYMTGRVLIPRVDAERYVVGMDYGQLQDPTQLGIAYQVDTSTIDWKMLMRIQVDGASVPAQSRLLQLIAWILTERLLARVCLDQQHAGLGVAQNLMEGQFGSWWAGTLLDFNANGTELVDPAGAAREDLELDGRIRQEPKKVRRKQYYTQILQSALLAAKTNSTGSKLRLWLGNDADVIQELIDTRERKTEAGNIVYLPRKMATHRPEDHNTDMARAIVAAALAAQDSEMDDTDEIEAMGAVKGNLFRRVREFA
jgi:hypothetical protein